MRVLYVVGSCLTKNTSANMSHNGYVQGLLENGCQVEILMAEDSWGQQDAALPDWDQAVYYCYPSVAVQDCLRKKLRGGTQLPVSVDIQEKADGAYRKINPISKAKACIRKLAKDAFYFCFPQDPVYPLEKTWLKKAMKFKSDTVYDLVISNSSPAASHKLVVQLLRRNRLKCKRWIQIWEDPWYFDLYGGHSENIRQEEHSLLREADEIYYVSPLTLNYQKQFYPDCAHKMAHIPLPYFDFSKTDSSASEKCSFGYFGDYYSHTRNLVPFYEALKQSGYRGYIYGDSNVSLESTPQIAVSGRVTLDLLSAIQAETGALVHLCNLRGGQIPGKIYHYSATDKPILFVLDGTEEEKRMLKDYFSQYNRYIFCENEQASILSAINEMCADFRTWNKLDVFSPSAVVGQLL